MKNLFLALLVIIFISFCGLPSSEQLEDLQLPLGLTAQVICNGETPTGIQISFYGYNNEIFFSGYNVYVVKSPYNPYDNVYYYVSSHKKTDEQNNPYFDQNIEYEAIVKNENNLYPTITLNYLLNNYPSFSQKPTKILYTINHTPPNVDTGSFITGTEYAIGVTAVSYSNIVETTISNVVSITYQCP